MFKYVIIAGGSWLAACKTPPFLAAHLSPALNCILLFLVYFVLVIKLNGIFESLLEARQAKKLGCEPPVTRRAKLPFGVDFILRMMASDRNNEVPEELPRIVKEMGVYTWKQHPLGGTAIVTVDPKNIQAILATQFHDFALGSLRNKMFFPLLGHGIFTVDGKYWEHSRALLRPQFARNQVADLELEETHVQHLFSHLRTDAQGWTSEIDLGPLFFRLTLDSATEFLFGHSVQSQIAALPKDAIEQQNYQKRDDLDWNKMAGCFDGALGHLGHRGRLRSLYWLHNPQTFKDDCKEVHRFADYYVNEAIKAADKSSTGGSSTTDIEKEGQSSSRYIFLNELVKSTRNPKEIRDQLLNILLAGRDTTAGLLGWTFWLLARHPEVLNKLRAVVLSDFGPSSSTKGITFSTLKSCTYLQQVLNEVLRLFPSVPINGRRAQRDTTIPRGGGVDGLSPVFVKKGSDIVYSVLAMQRRKDLWGPDAEVFRPERWNPASSSASGNTKNGSESGGAGGIGTKARGWEYLPFNGGPRICLGQQFALTEAGYVIVRILQRFDRVVTTTTTTAASTGSEGHGFKHQFGLTSAPLNVFVRLHSATSTSTADTTV